MKNYISSGFAMNLRWREYFEYLKTIDFLIAKLENEKETKREANNKKWMPLVNRHQLNKYEYTKTHLQQWCLISQDYTGFNLQYTFPRRTPN